jgi:hypothetical protein
MDVRVFSGAEVQTHRFPFKVRVSYLNCILGVRSLSSYVSYESTAVKFHQNNKIVTFELFIQMLEKEN